MSAPTNARRLEAKEVTPEMARAGAKIVSELTQADASGFCCALINGTRWWREGVKDLDAEEHRRPQEKRIADLEARLEANPSTTAQEEISEAMNGLAATRITVGDFMWARDIKRPWTQCPSTHCERAAECRSPHECSAKSRVNRFGLALMMIREGCEDPREVARAALAAAARG